MKSMRVCETPFLKKLGCGYEFLKGQRISNEDAAAGKILGSKLWLPKGQALLKTKIKVGETFRPTPKDGLIARRKMYSYVKCSIHNTQSKQIWSYFDDFVPGQDIQFTVEPWECKKCEDGGFFEQTEVGNGHNQDGGNPLPNGGAVANGQVQDGGIPFPTTSPQVVAGPSRPIVGGKQPKLLQMTPHLIIARNGPTTYDKLHYLICKQAGTSIHRLKIGMPMKVIDLIETVLADLADKAHEIVENIKDEFSDSDSGEEDEDQSKEWSNDDQVELVGDHYNRKIDDPAELKFDDFADAQLDEQANPQLDDAIQSLFEGVLQDVEDLKKLDEENIEVQAETSEAKKKQPKKRKPVVMTEREPRPKRKCIASIALYNHH